MPTEKDIEGLGRDSPRTEEEYEEEIAKLLDSDEFEDRVREHPPSVKLVYLILQDNGEMTMSDLGEASLLKKRTIRYALENLGDEGLVYRRDSPFDARKTLYGLPSSDFVEEYVDEFNYSAVIKGIQG